MFCPQCGVENQDQIRFCRSCGTELDAVVLALDTRTASPSELSSTRENDIELAQQRLQLQVDGIHRVVRGALIFVTGILFGIPLALFSKDTDWHSNWILVWLVTCGWLPVWGAFMIGTGLSNLIHSRMTQQRIDWLFGVTGAPSAQDSGEPRRLDKFTDDPSDSLNAAQRTTASMNDPVADE